LDFTFENILSADISIERALVQRIAALDHDVAHLFGKLWLMNQVNHDFLVAWRIMPLTECDQLVRVEQLDHAP
jgi:hypothetical protein